MEFRAFYPGEAFYDVGEKALRIDPEEIRALGRMVEPFQRERKGVKPEK
jgi:hypothetical protein